MRSPKFRFRPLFHMQLCLEPLDSTSFGLRTSVSAPYSTSSITRLVTVTETGEPMAVPKVCWYTSPLYDK